MTHPALLALATFGAIATAASAAAVSFSPAPTSFSATGVLNLASLQTGTKCEITLKGRVNKKGVGKIDSLTFAGNSQCAGTTATALPWKVLASGASLGKIVGFGFSGSFFGDCGSGTVPFTDDASGDWSLSATLPSGCTVNGFLNTTPPIVIVSP
ncbi:MAG: hypothetical protein ABI056_06925 [Caulobacteraceae bacterium]